MIADLLTKAPARVVFTELIRLVRTFHEGGLHVPLLNLVAATRPRRPWGNRISTPRTANTAISNAKTPNFYYCRFHIVEPNANFSQLPETL